MKWYEQQTRSSTNFTTIEHHRVLKAPFHHEYLLIHLDDGAICRLERMGEGSTTDAIRRAGCTAHDLIQWFTKDGYNNHPLSKEPSELVARVEFPQSFDLLDVLAVCFSVQDFKLSSAYTLQRYNCYFLCLTVLNVLVRRTAGWESAITKDEWTAAVDNMINELRTMECKDEYEKLGIGLSALANPNMPDPRNPVLDLLSGFLHRNAGLANLVDEVQGTLWHRDLGAVSHNGPKHGVEYATGIAIGGSDICSTRMKYLLYKNMSTEPIDESTVISASEVIPPKLQQKLLLSMMDPLVMAFSSATKSAAVTYALREVEDPTPLHLRLLCPVLAMVICAAVGFRLTKKQEDFFQLDGANIMTRMRVVTRLLPLFVHSAKIFIIENSNDPSLQDMKVFNREAQLHSRIAATNSVIHSALCEGLEVTSSLRSINFDVDCWKLCLRVCVGRHLNKVVKIAERCSLMGTIKVYTSADPKGTQISVADFQGFPVKRKHDHAARVATVGLAAAPLVHSEIERTMANVWKEMPDRRSWDPANRSEGDLQPSSSELSLESYRLNELFD